MPTARPSYQSPHHANALEQLAKRFIVLESMFCSKLINRTLASRRRANFEPRNWGRKMAAGGKLASASAAPGIDKIILEPVITGDRRRRNILKPNSLSPIPWALILFYRLAGAAPAARACPCLPSYAHLYGLQIPRTPCA